MDIPAQKSDAPIVAIFNDGGFPVGSGKIENRPLSFEEAHRLKRDGMLDRLGLYVDSLERLGNSDISGELDHVRAFLREAEKLASSEVAPVEDPDWRGRLVFRDRQQDIGTGTTDEFVTGIADLLGQIDSSSVKLRPLNLPRLQDALSAIARKAATAPGYASVTGRVEYNP